MKVLFKRRANLVYRPLAHFPAVVCSFSWRFPPLITAGTACLLFSAITRNSPLNSWPPRGKTADGLARDIVLQAGHRLGSFSLCRSGFPFTITLHSV